MDSQNKQFLWDNGVAKIAHHSLIGDYSQGGIRYKDIEYLMLSINLKFLSRMKTNGREHNGTALPRFWLMNLFHIPTKCESGLEEYWQQFFATQLNVLDCKFKLPRKNKWKGHPYYFELLSTMEKLQEEYPSDIEALMSIPIWYNKMLGTQFCTTLSKVGFNFLRDIHYFMQQKPENVNKKTAKELIKLHSKIDPWLKRQLDKANNKQVVIQPLQGIKVNNVYKALHQMRSSDL